MRRVFQAWLMAITLAASAPSQAQVTYDFHSLFDDSFVIITPGLITADTTFTNPSTCLVLGELPCLRVDFFIDAFDHLLTPDYGWQAVAVTSQAGIAYYYFEGGTFASLGLHETVAGVSTATLAISVPELSAAQAMALGLPMLAVLVRRRRQRS
jgi:hypothetical protein